MTDVAEVASVAPATVEELAGLLRQASVDGTPIQVIGGGTRLGYGNPDLPGLVIRMSDLSGIEVWDPDDLTVTVGAGTQIEELESALAERSQTAVLSEVPGESTVGGTIAAGISSLRRGRLLGTRERMLEVTLVTGDGRVIRGGGRVVKNVTGYDLPRLVVGAFGSLGVIVSVCLKLWPVPSASASVTLDDPERAGLVSRPLATLSDDGVTRVYLWGTRQEVEASGKRLGGEVEPGLHWPADPTGRYRWSLRVPPASTTPALARLPAGWRHLAVFGAGDVRLGSDDADGAIDLRRWAESLGGHLVVVDRPMEEAPRIDPWGTPPPGLDIQRRLISQFDPARILNRGRLPGGI